MAFCPHTPFMYILWTSLYSLSNGLAYAGFTAFVLDAIGKGAAASKYNVYAGLGTLPVYLMTIIDGLAYNRWGAMGMLYTEAACVFIGFILFFTFKISTSKRPSLAIVTIVN